MAAAQPTDQVVQSMTGSGTATGETKLGLATFECRSVNGRGLTVKMRLPPEVQGIEAGIEQRVRAQIPRGTVHVSLTVDDSAAAAGDGVDVELGVRVAASLRALAERSGTELTLSDILAVPGVLPDRGRSGPKRSRELAAEEADVLDAALSALRESRAQEGQATLVAIRAELEALATALAEVRTLAPAIIDDYRARVLGRVNEFLDGRARLMEPDEIIREVSVFADRVDIAEELQRLAAHLGKADELLGAGGTVGRNLEFLVQEMLREVNTLGSKSPDVRIAHLVVAMKSSIDKLKEQAANLA